jgi:hypothetical protein
MWELELINFHFGGQLFLAPDSLSPSGRAIQLNSVGRLLAVDQQA